MKNRKSQIKKIINSIGNLSKLKTNLIGVDFFSEVNEHIIRLGFI